MVLFTNALKLTTNYENELMEKNNLIENLHKQVDSLKGDNVAYDKIIYMDGALWMLEKMEKDLIRIKESITVAIVTFKNELERNVVDNKYISLNILKLYQYFGDNIDKQIESIFDKIEVMKQSTQKSMRSYGLNENSQNHVKSVF